MLKISNVEFVKKFTETQESSGTSYRQLDKYTHSHTKMRFKCPEHGIFLKTAGDILRGTRCPECSILLKYAEKKVAARKRYVEKLRAQNIELLDTEFLLNSRMKHFCTVCSTTFLSLRATLLGGSGCPNCASRPVPKTRARHTEASFVEALVSNGYAVSMQPGTFSALGKQAVFKCATHGKFTVPAKNALTYGCLACKKEASAGARMLDRSTWEERIKEKHGDRVRLLGQYRGVASNTRYRFKCYVCFNTWKAQLPSVGISGTGCPHCVNQQKAKNNTKFRVKVFERDGITFRVQGWEYQAIVWLLDKKKIKASDILTESSSKVPVFRYKFGRRTHNYYPDILLPKLNRIIEVKSPYTLGINGGRKSGMNWRKNQAKAAAVLAAGYKYTLMLMDASGTRCSLPPNWHTMSARDVMVWIAFHNGEYLPAGVKHSRTDLSYTAHSSLQEDICTEAASHKRAKRRKRIYIG